MQISWFHISLKLNSISFYILQMCYVVIWMKIALIGIISKDWGMWSYWKKCSFVGGNVSLGDGLWGFKYSSQGQCLFLFQLPANLNVELSALSSALCLACIPRCFLSYYMDQIYKPISQPQLNIFLYNSCYGHGSNFHYPFICH